MTDAGACECEDKPEADQYFTQTILLLYSQRRKYEIDAGLEKDNPCTRQQQKNSNNQENPTQTRHPTFLDFGHTCHRQLDRAIAGSQQNGVPGHTHEGACEPDCAAKLVFCNHFQLVTSFKNPLRFISFMNKNDSLKSLSACGHQDEKSDNQGKKGADHLNKWLKSP